MPAMAIPEPTPSPVRKASRARKAASKTAAKKESSAPKKTGGKRKSASPDVEPSDAEIRLRAYFIAERRLQLALHGDPANDWIEARKQLLAEERRARK